MPKLYTVDELALSIGTSDNTVRKGIKNLKISSSKTNGKAKLYTYADLKKLYKLIVGMAKPEIKIDLGRPEDYIPLCFQNMETDEELLKHIEATEKRIARRRAQLALLGAR